jgi:hypothetical protein
MDAAKNWPNFKAHFKAAQKAIKKRSKRANLPSLPTLSVSMNM